MGIDGIMIKTNKQNFDFDFEKQHISSSHFTVIFGYLTTAIALPLKKPFSCQKCDYEIDSSAPSVRLKIKLIKGLTIVIFNYLIRTLGIWSIRSENPYNGELGKSL